MNDKRAILAALTSRRILNIIAYYLNSFLGNSLAFARPISVDIEPTINCNLACPFCHNKELRREKRQMPISEFREALDAFSEAIRVNIQGMGEPLLNPEIASMIAYAKSKNHFVTMTTNGTLLDEAKAEAIFAAGLDRLIVSFDTTDKEAFARLRPGANIDQVKENIRRASAIRRNRTTRLVLWTLLLEDSALDLRSLFDFAIDAGVDGVGLQMNISDWGKRDWRSRMFHIRTEWPGLSNDLSYAHRLGLRVNLHKRINAFKKDRKSLCRVPWGSVYVASDGRLAPCCLAPDPAYFSLGHLSEGFKNIWNNQAYRTWRQAMKKGDIPDYCRQCYENTTDK